ncbi:type VII secretion protein EccE [Micromonospora craniellae]|uniref:Type VII secretion protein EccE n=1 Tax=Micromonospora craniellae TaxID=2294034 RepID=A0A372FW17_9ACTN|nr:type VII secretion protein EccE [Micromonospora craniellae]QOC94082.1 type VII secretion protein EccE [Micromonospora craniellae]RFS44736.1 type VII secretion protein EccE [Micromonospora craniellae]
MTSRGVITEEATVPTTGTLLRRPADASGPDRRVDGRHGPQWRRNLRHAYRPAVGQIVTTQVAAAVLVAAPGRDALPTAAAVLTAGALLVGAWGRVRRRWLHEWLRIGAGYLARRRRVNRPTALLDLVAPESVVRPAELAGSAAAALDDPDGLVALLDIGDPADLLGAGARSLPLPTALLPARTAEAPPVRVQLLLTVTAAPAVAAGGGPVATSYRQLTDGRLAGGERAVLAVRVTRVAGWPEEVLRRALAGTVRRIMRRLRPLPVRPLGTQATLRVLAELAHHDGRPPRETWQGVRCGGLLQSTFGLRRWPTEPLHRLVPRLANLPVTATTVSLHADTEAPDRTELTVRLSAATPAELAAAGRTLKQVVATAGGVLVRHDGAHLHGFAGTLPLARPARPVTRRRAPSTPGSDDTESTLPYGSAGLMLGTNRHGEPVTVRLFRPESTRVMLVGGVPTAQLVAVRAMALGARVVVQTTRPHAWEPFVRGVGVPGRAIPLVPPDRPAESPPATPLAPVLVVRDAPPPPPGPRPGAAWQTTLQVRDELTPADADALARADLAVLSPLSRAESAVAGGALGLGAAAPWLARIRPDMVAVVNRRALRWALLAVTPIEAQLIEAPVRTRQS